MKRTIQKVITFVLVGMGVAMAAILIVGAFVGYDPGRTGEVGHSMFPLALLFAGVYLCFGAPDELFWEGKLKKDLREAEERANEWQRAALREMGRVEGLNHKMKYLTDLKGELEELLVRKDDELKLATIRNEFLEAKVRELVRWQVEHTHGGEVKA